MIVEILGKGPFTPRKSERLSEKDQGTRIARSEHCLTRAKTNPGILAKGGPTSRNNPCVFPIYEKNARIIWPIRITSYILH